MTRKLRNMKELSDVAGLSRPTVSKYFHDPASVRASTRVKIETALKRFDYRPSFLAVNQNRRRPKTVGIIVPQLIDPFYADLVGRIELDCIARGYTAIILSSHGAPEDEARAISMMLSLNIGGVILAPLGAQSDARRIGRLRGEVPLLLLDSYIEADLPVLSCDNAQGIGLMVDYLCGSGTPPVYIDMPAVTSSARERREAYLAAMARRGEAPEVLGSPHTSWSFEKIGREIARRQIAAGGFSTGTVLCGNDRFAIGVLSAASEAGLRVGPGGDLRVAGHDDHPAAAYASPPLTTVAQDMSGLAAEAVATILGAMEDGPPALGHRRLPSKLVLRASA